MLSHTKEIGTPPLFIMVGLAPEILRGKRKLAFLALLPGIHYTIKMVNKYSFLQVSFCKKPKFSKTKIENWNWVQFMNSSFIFPSLLKVSKSEKHFFLGTPLPKKWMKFFTKVSPMKLGQNFVKYFVRFLGNGVSRKMLLRFTDL